MTDPFVELVRDQLEGASDLRLKSTFGGWGIYSGPSFFGAVFDGRLYFRTDESGTAAFLRYGMGPFTCDGGALKSLWEVPPDVLEDPRSWGNGRDVRWRRRERRSWRRARARRGRGGWECSKGEASHGVSRGEG